MNGIDYSHLAQKVLADLAAADEAERLAEMAKPKCMWAYHTAQFAGGPFMYSGCGNAYAVEEKAPDICPGCGRPIVEEEGT